ncbi:MAG: DinB family protein [Bryobacterales bacterium]|nr:DinB family protein [Bryobacterales bacterium]
MRRKPESNEAAGHFWTYIDKVEGGEVAPALERQTAEFAALLGRVSEEASLARYEPGKWSVRETVGHINDTERVFAHRAFWFARGLAGEQASMDQDVCAAHAGSDVNSLAALAAEFTAVRAATMSLVKMLPSEAWARWGIASGNPVTVRALVWVICGHLEHHERILRERYGLR